MSIEARILLDSVNPLGNRITTWVLKFPRFILPEFNTHRAFSRNASSSRAIPVKKMLEDVKNNPAMPVFWGKNQSGMQAAEELDDTTPLHLWERNGSPYPDPYTTTARRAVKDQWLKARDAAIYHVEEMVKFGLHKQIANRLLEPWMHITVLATATEHENFFALRAHKDAQPEFQALAYKMLDLYQSNHPTKLKEGEWHIPFGDKIDPIRVYDAVSGSCGDFKLYQEACIKIATARCARVSYLNFDGKDDYMADLALTKRLSESGHWSPFEHCAIAQSGEIARMSGNFRGWEQYRKQFPQENRRDGRVPDILPATMLY